MSQHIQHEMTSCLTEMQRLQEKMEKLQQEKIIQEQQQKEKISEIEPNMAVIENWLKSVVGERENTQKAKNLYESLTKDTSPEKRQEILKLRKVYYNGRLDKWMPPDPGALFHIQKNLLKNCSIDTPSQFMIDFIEATHNLFQIQQKRIDELENVVAQIAINEN